MIDMWVCQRCHTENKDTLATCPSCGTPRPVRRFGSSPQTHAAPPAVSSARTAAPQQESAASPAAVPDARSAARAAYQAAGQPDEAYYDDEEEMERPRRGGSVFGKLVGGLLIVLLPLLVGLLAWRQYDTLCEALLPLYLTEKAPDWLRSVFYGMLTAAAVLLSMLPGLWTILLSRKPGRQ
ncbi:MAG: zinc ribbon domain-containing protein [Clostridia bacterium]|nr:zinc ribbon domain-containing protein [Clostridia bacterium]